MKIQTTQRINSKSTARKLHAKGYVGRVTVINNEYRKKFNIPDYPKLRDMAESNQIDAIKLYTEDNPSYWFLKEQIETLWINSEVDNIQTTPKKRIEKSYQQELFNVRDRCIEDIERKAKELLGILDCSKFDYAPQVVKKDKETVIVKCPYTILAAQKIFAEGVAAALTGRVQFIIEYAEKVKKLDSMIIKNESWENKHIDMDSIKIGMTHEKYN